MDEPLSRRGDYDLSLFQMLDRIARRDAFCSVVCKNRVLESFCDFLARLGYGKDAETIRVAPPKTQQVYLLRVIDAVQAGQLVFHPWDPQKV